MQKMWHVVYVLIIGVLCLIVSFSGRDASRVGDGINCTQFRGSSCVSEERFDNNNLEQIKHSLGS
jgi:hypothetical protein